MVYSELDERCKKCVNRDFCKDKRLAACAAMPLTQDLTQPLLVKHDYRDIKIDANTTVTIDLEKLKEQLKERFCPFDYGA